MSLEPSSHLPKPRVPAWERRRGPQRRRWNGRRREDPRLPVNPDSWARASQVLLKAFAGILLGLGMILLAMH